MQIKEYFVGFFSGLWSLLVGMSVTLREFFTKKTTEQYPENRKTLVMFDRFRGELIMPHDQNNNHKCIACGLCQMACPNQTIQVISKQETDADGKTVRVLDKYIYDLGSCMFCQLCTRACPHDAIRFDTTFENAVFTRSKLIMQLNHDGSSVVKKDK